MDDHWSDYEAWKKSQQEVERLQGILNSSEVLATAAEFTSVERAGSYGHPRVNLGERTASMMTAYLSDLGLSRPLNIADVCNLMIIVKMARLQENPEHFDSLVDIAGYASAAWVGRASVAEQVDAPASKAGSL